MIPLIPDFVELWVWDRCYAVALDRSVAIERSLATADRIRSPPMQRKNANARFTLAVQ